MRVAAAPTLETARLTLRAHLASDVDAVAAISGDPEVMRQIGGGQSREESWRRMLCGPAMWALLGYGYWVVERRDDAKLIGQVGLADFKREMKPPIEGLPELGYVLSGSAHGQGFAGEAVSAVLDWADKHLNAEQTVAIIDPGNAASIRVAERAGFAHREPATYKGEPILLFRRHRVRT